MSDFLQQLQRASAPQQPAARSDASAHFHTENPQDGSPALHQVAAHEKRPAHSDSRSQQQKGSAAVCKQPDVAAEVEKLRQIASTRNAAAQAGSRHAAPSSTVVAAEVEELRQLASTRNAAAQAGKRHAAPSSSVIAAEVEELRQLASTRKAAAQAASRHAAPSSTVVAAEVEELAMKARVRELRQEAAQALKDDARRSGSKMSFKQAGVAARMQEMHEQTMRTS